MAVGAASRLMTLHGRCHVMQGLLCHSRSSSLMLRSPHRCCVLPDPRICPLNRTALTACLDTWALGSNWALAVLKHLLLSCTFAASFPVTVVGPSLGPCRRKGLP